VTVKTTARMVVTATGPRLHSMRTAPDISALEVFQLRLCLHELGVDTDTSSSMSMKLMLFDKSLIVDRPAYRRRS